MKTESDWKEAKGQIISDVIIQLRKLEARDIRLEWAFTRAVGSGLDTCKSWEQVLSYLRGFVDFSLKNTDLTQMVAVLVEVLINIEGSKKLLEETINLLAEKSLHEEKLQVYREGWKRYFKNTKFLLDFVKDILLETKSNGRQDVAIFFLEVLYLPEGEFAQLIKWYEKNRSLCFSDGEFVKKLYYAYIRWVGFEKIVNERIGLEKN